MHCRSSAASYDVLNVCENCFKIYGALHNIKKHQECQKKFFGMATVDQSSSSSNALQNTKLLPPPTGNISGSASMTPEPRKFETSALTSANASSSIGLRFLGSPNTDHAKSTSPNSSPSPPNQSSPNQSVTKSASPLSRSRRKSTLGNSMHSDSSETGDPLAVNMEWRIKNFSQKQAEGKLDSKSFGGHGAGRHLVGHPAPESVANTAADASPIDAVPVPIRDPQELTRLLRHELNDQLWDDDIFQREMRDEKYYFELCRNWDGKVAVLVAVENELKLLPPKEVLGMLAVNMKMPGFVKFSLLKPTFNAERKHRRALAEAKLRVKSMTVGQRRVTSVS